MSYLYANDGTTLITQFYEEYRKYVPLSEISPNMLKAIVSSEDSRFYDHHGVDTRGVLRAFIANQQAGGVSQGASTLTMQYVRNVQRDSATTPQEVQEATEQTNVRKLREMRLAVAGGEGADQGADPREVPQRRVLRAPRVRHLRRGRGLLLQEPQGPDPRPRRPCWPVW